MLLQLLVTVTVTGVKLFNAYSSSTGDAFSKSITLLSLYVISMQSKLDVILPSVLSLFVLTLK